MIRLILLVYIFCYNAKTSAQVSININGGLNYSNFSYRLFGDEYYNIYQKYLKYSALYNFGIGVEYKIKRITFESGIGIATRGAKDYEPTFLHKGYYVIEHGFIELPVLMAYEILNKRIHVGGGFLVSYRAGENSVYQGYENKLFGLDTRVFIRFDFNRRISTNVSYTFGNLDKYLFRVEDNFLHHVFALNFKYNFWILKN